MSCVAVAYVMILLGAGCWCREQRPARTTVDEASPAAPVDPVTDRVEALARAGCSFQPARVLVVDAAEKTAREGAPRPADPAMLARLNEATGRRLPAGYLLWMSRYDGFSVFCPGATPLHVVPAETALELYDGGTLGGPILEIGSDGGGDLYSIDLEGRWGRGTGAVWLVDMSDPNQPMVGAPTLDALLDILAAGTDLWERAAKDPTWEIHLQPDRPARGGQED